MVDKITLLDLVNLVFITGVFYGLVFSSTLFFMKRKIGKPLLFLNLQVLFITLNNLQAWLIDMNLVSSFVYIRYLRLPWFVLCMPMFYMFLVRYLKLSKNKYRVLETTVVLFASFALIRLGLIYHTQQNGFVEAETKSFMDSYSSIEEIVCYLYTLFIFALSLITFYGRQKLFTRILEFDDLKWIKHSMNLAALILVIWLIAILMSIGHGVFSSPEIYYPLRLSTTILIYWIGFKGFFRIRIKEDRIVLRKNIRKRISTDEKEFEWENEEIEQGKSEKGKVQFERVNAFVRNENLFLDPYLSLDTLAAKSELSSGYLSSLINKHSSHNFSDYINEFRVDHAKRLINDPEFNEYTVLSIGLESGFNSKSTFYKAFKKFTGMTPLEFRKGNL